MTTPPMTAADHLARADEHHAQWLRHQFALACAADEMNDLRRKLAEAEAQYARMADSANVHSAMAATDRAEAARLAALDALTPPALTCSVPTITPDVVK